METTLCVLLVDHILPLRRLVVALPLLGASGFAKSNTVALSDFPFAYKTIECFDFTITMRSALTPSRLVGVDEQPRTTSSLTKPSSLSRATRLFTSTEDTYSFGADLCLAASSALAFNSARFDWIQS